ncbi:MAG: WD40 repeat domain-containing protein, partial [Anaerolineales bacterium]|nr:WD40 repeat domain-containing protein [Anaerolineales bacterium]
YPHAARVCGVAFDPNGARLATASWDGTATIWQAETGQALHNLSGHTDGVTTITFSPDGALVATGSDDGLVKLWDASSGAELSTLAGHIRQESGFFTGVMGVAFSPDGARLVTAGTDGVARMWDVATLQRGDLKIGDELLSLEGHAEQEDGSPEWITDLDISSDGRRIATSSGDGTIKVWSAETGEELWTLSGDPPKHFWSVAFSPDGRRLAAGDWGGRIIVWDLPADPTGTPEELYTNQISSDGGWIAKLSFSPDGTQLAVPGIDGMGLYDANTGEFLGTFPHPSSVIETAYSPDGKRLATAGQDGAGRLFILDADELMALAKSRLTRGLTTEECQTYLHQDECPKE